MTAHRVAMRGPYDPDVGRQAVEQLGGLDEEAYEHLDDRPSDFKRRQTLKNWFGSHGATYAWGLYLERRRQQQHD